MQRATKEGEMSGGTQWELQSAWDMIKLARQNDDIAAEELGWLRYSEGLRNVAVSALSAQLIPMLEELKATRVERATDAKVIRHNLDLLVRAAELMQDRVAALEDTRGTRSRMLLDIEHDLSIIKNRIGAIEDHFEDDGIISTFVTTLHQLDLELVQIKQALNDAKPE